MGNDSRVMVRTDQATVLRDDAIPGICPENRVPEVESRVVKVKPPWGLLNY